MHHDAKFNWTPIHQAAFINLKRALTLHYLDPLKQYKIYIDTSDDTCGAQLSQQYKGQELPVTFLSHTFMDTLWKLSTPKQKAYGIYYVITK